MVGKLTDALHKLPPPEQPWLKEIAKNYQETTSITHPAAIKGGAGYFQFLSPQEETSINLLPDPSFTVWFELDPMYPTAWITGVHEDLQRIELKADTLYFGVKLLSTFGLKNNSVSSREMFGQQAALAEMFPAEEITERILFAASMEDRVSQFQQHFLNNWVDHEHQPELDETMAALICMHEGKVQLQDIEEELHYSSRYCRKIFQSTFELTPKRYSRIVRFIFTVRQLLADSMKNGLVSVANSAGFYDQSHFINEFKKYCGMTPNQFMDRFGKA